MADAFLYVLLILDATFRVATPLVLAALAGMFSERSGVIDIGLEGKMLGSAFAAAACASVTGSAWAGLLVGVAAAIALSMLHGFACITHRGNQVVSGMAINIVVAGLAPTLGFAWFHQGGQTPPLSGDARFASLTLPFADATADWPIIGPLYSELISGHNIIVYMAAAAVPIAAWILFRTRFGLRIRAVGENPHAVDTAGISVVAIRYRALIVTGILCGIAGSYLSIAHGAGFARDMTAGKGYLALAALVFGKWKPVPTLFACLLFAFTDALQARLQGADIPGIGVIPVQFIQALPYILTVLLLAGFVGRAIPPKAIGQPYVKER
ncbi:ABC transporter permease [Oceanibacterium hippocampi]|uniref:L-arabinose transporter permease protein n=1 Tax=Oceanibacterium hippocampi TaxID=745714 RepID=A0A1Y5TW06_9PROT|nr:ABC transporter permease [Oceanibacterium hippocampi]SLN74700.1 L-arabinose transporter permease protein [Oceanibacterium hippocampi]